VQIRIKGGVAGATLSKREKDALDTTLTVLEFLARNDLFAITVYSSLVAELKKRGAISEIPSTQTTLDLKDTEEADGKVAKT
jgi:hypothetical protein